MVVIVSAFNEPTTNQVIDWLGYHGVDFVRINPDTPLSGVRIDMEGARAEMSIRIGDRRVALREVRSVWYRRGWFQIGHHVNLAQLPAQLHRPISAQLELELKSLNDFVSQLWFGRGVNRPSDNELNKLLVLQRAASLGLAVPTTLVTSDISDVCKFRAEHGRIITKNMAPGVFVKQNETMLQGFTREVTDEVLAMLPEVFFPMLFQALLSKVYEVRTFYLNGRTWSSAIFSQSSDRTLLDFRNYDVDRPNRTPPYVLPSVVDQRLCQLMRALGLASGSIDFIVDANGEHYFLEVNAIGQFWQVSYPCNYYLEDELARHLAAS